MGVSEYVCVSEFFTYFFLPLESNCNPDAATRQTSTEDAREEGNTSMCREGKAGQNEDHKRDRNIAAGHPDCSEEPSIRAARRRIFADAPRAIVALVAGVTIAHLKTAARRRLGRGENRQALCERRRKMRLSTTLTCSAC